MFCPWSHVAATTVLLLLLEKIQMETTMKKNTSQSRDRKRLPNQTARDKGQATEKFRDTICIKLADEAPHSRASFAKESMNSRWYHVSLVSR